MPAALLLGISRGTTAYGDGLFSSGVITGESDSGVNSGKTYTAAANVIGSDVSLNGVTFTGSGTATSGTNWAITGAGNTFASGGNKSSATGNLPQLFDGFQYGGNPAHVTLSGLTAGQTYIATFYGQAFATDNRTQNITTSDGASVSYDEDAQDVSVLRYSFVAGGSTTTLNFLPQAVANTMHFYGLSNEQVFTNSYNGGTDWNSSSWSVGNPNAVASNALFPAASAPTSINIDAPTTVGHIEFDGTNAYTLTGTQILTFQADKGGASIINTTSGSHTISGPVVLGSTIGKMGAGTLNFTGSVSGANGATVSNGTLVISNAAADLTSFGDVKNNAAFQINSAAAQAYNGAISGTGAFTKAGGGTLTLGNASTYTGATNISAGTLRLAGTSPLALNIPNANFEQAGSAGASNGQWSYNPSSAVWTFNTSSGIAANASPWVTTAPEGNHVGFLQNSGSSITQSLTVDQSGSYTVTFQAANRPSHNADGLLLKVDGVTLASFAATGFNNAGAFKSYSATVNLAAGTHTFGFVGNNTIGGDVATAIDTIAASGSSSGALPPTSAVVITNAASLDINDHVQTVGSLAGDAGTSVTLGSGALTVGQDNTNTTFNGTISDGGGASGNSGGSLTKSGNGTLVLTAANTYTGGTTINGGTSVISLQITHPAALGSGAITLNTGGTLGLNHNGTTSNAIVVNGSSSLFVGGYQTGAGTGATPTLTGGITSDGQSGTFTVYSNGRQVGSNNLTFSGNTLALGSKTFAILGQKGGNVDTMADALGQLTTLSNATLATTADLTVGRGALLVAGTSSVTLGGQLKTSSDWADFKMQDSASVTATGGIDFHANNVVASQMELNGGTLTTPSIIGNSYNGTKVNFNGTHVVVSPGAGNADFLEVYLNSSRTTTTSASIDAGGAIIDTAGNNANINIGFANSGATVKGNLKKLGAGTLTLAGASSYSGGTTINAGTLALAGSGTLGVAGNALSLNSGATLDLGGTTQTVGQVNAAAAGNGAVGTITNGSIVMNGAAFYLQNGTFTANLSGSGASRLWIGGDSAATVFLGGINTSTYTDSHSTIIGHATTGAAGTVALLSPTALGPASQQTQVFAGTLDLNGQSGVSVGSIVLESGVSSAFVNNNTSAAASFNNTLDLNANTPSVGGNGTLSLGGVVQNGTLKKVGSGTLILAGNNSYSGGTTVTAGTLLAGNSAGSATGSGLVTVASNAVVGGSGTIGGALKLDGGSIRPSAGNNANGVQLTLSGGLSITANGGAYVPQLISTANYDSLSVASSVNIAGATLALDDSSYVPSALVNDKFYIIQGTTPISGTFTNAPATYTDAFGITYQVEYNVAGPNATTNDVALTVQSVPEPTSLALAAAGLCGLLARRRRKA